MLPSLHCQPLLSADNNRSIPLAESISNLSRSRHYHEYRGSSLSMHDQENI